MFSLSVVLGLIPGSKRKGKREEGEMGKEEWRKWEQEVSVALHSLSWT